MVDIKKQVAYTSSKKPYRPYRRNHSTNSKLLLQMQNQKKKKRKFPMKNPLMKKKL